MPLSVDLHIEIRAKDVYHADDWSRARSATIFGSLARQGRHVDHHMRSSSPGIACPGMLHGATAQHPRACNELHLTVDGQIECSPESQG